LSNTPREQHEAVIALQKLGQRVRAVYAKQLPIPQRSLEMVRTNVHEQYDQEQAAKPSEPGIEP